MMDKSSNASGNLLKKKPVINIKKSASNTSGVNDNSEDRNMSIKRVTTEKIATQNDSTQCDTLLDFSYDKVVQGIIYSEILGKPRAYRKGRW